MRRASRTVAFALVVLASAGCATRHAYPVPKQPFSGYPAAAPIPLSVELVLTSELLAAHWEQTAWPKTFEIPLGAVLAMNAEALARSTFSDVAVSRSYALQAGSAPAVLTPRVVAIERTPLGRYSWQDITLTVVLEWRLEARGGALVWLDTVTGSNTSSLTFFSADEASEERTAAVMDILFRNASEVMRRSPEIARFAAKTATP